MKGSELKALLGFAEAPKKGEYVRPVLGCVHFTEKYAEACNGHILGRVYYDPDEAPKGTPFCVNLQGIKWGAKDAVSLSHEDGEVTVTVGQMAYKLEAETAAYPDCEKVWTDAGRYLELLAARIKLDNKYMKPIINLASTLDDAIVWEVGESYRAARFSTENERVKGLIMPIFLTDKQGEPQPSRLDEALRLLRLCQQTMANQTTTNSDITKTLGKLANFLGDKE